MAPAHTRSACIPPFCVRPLPEWPHTRAAANSLHPRRSKINTDIPRDAKISVASTGLLPLCHRRRNTAQCTHLFSSCSVSRLLHTFSDGLTPTKARHKSHCDRTSSCDERPCVHGSAAHTCWQAACSRCPRASPSAPAWERENGQFLVYLFPPAVPTRWSSAVIPQHIQEC
ncbi:hypothetical protein TcCL_ESM11381 [Trypanosoma cruzi]|nr:hypothetical protein TcCL_ESM11381 [Trypanosoma cruzi]